MFLEIKAIKNSPYQTGESACINVKVVSESVIMQCNKYDNSLVDEIFKLYAYHPQHYVVTSLTIYCLLMGQNRILI